MDINGKLNLINFAMRKAVGVETPCDRESAIGYAQALCHAKIITPEKFRELTDAAQKAYKDHKHAKQAADKQKAR